ncbi:hypothetical protein GCM10007978_28430 [Shewanella hanedai]|nr:hypothetical protein GCM10007978_28430 [Shewanella hanedai]
MRDEALKLYLYGRYVICLALFNIKNENIVAIKVENENNVAMLAGAKMKINLRFYEKRNQCGKCTIGYWPLFSWYDLW